MKELKEAQMGIITILALMLVSIKRRLPDARRLSSGITTLALVGIVLLVAAGSASAANCGAGTGNACQCGDTVVGDWTFTGDMVCTDETVCGLIIGADGITINGAGYSMTGDVTSATCTASQTSPCVTHSGVINTGGWDNVVVKNLEITNFNTGVVIGTAGMGDTEENMTVTGCNIHDCGKSLSVTHGIHLVGANYCTITKNAIHHIEGQGIAGGCGGGGNGIFMHGDTAQMSGFYGDYNNITCNYLHHNKKSGFFMKFQCMYCNISYNKATDNTQSGIMPKCEMSNYNTIEYNNMSDNGANGFYCGGDNNTVRHNTAKNNGAAGIEFKSSADHNTVEHNFVCGHTTDILLGDPDNSGDENTCDTGPSGWCDWSCGNEVAVYYDYDKDGQCSKKWDDCPCALPGIGSKCACCNPGLFNGSSAATTAYENSCNRDCQFGTPGPDPNDCDLNIKGIIKPDLIVANKSEAWFNDTQYNVSYRVQNIGNATSNESEACVYIDMAHQAGSDMTIGVLAPDEYSTIQTVGPFTMSGTSDTIKVCADCTDTNDEWDETNNCTENVWSANQPDLTIIEKHEEWVDQAAGTYNITYTVKNIGTATAPASKTRVRIDGIPTGTAGNVQSLAPDAEFTETLPYNITMSGSYDTIELKADGNNGGAGVIDELNETNNCITNTFSSAPTISVVAPDGCVTPGTFYVNINITPNGNDIYGVQYKLTYNKSVIRLQMQNKGTFLERDGKATMVTNNVIDNINGIATYAITRKDTTAGISDPEGTFAVLTFTTVGNAGETSILDLSEIVISDPQALPIDSPVLINDDVEICAANQAPTAVAKSDHKYNNVGSMYACSATLNGSESSDMGGIADWAWAFDDGQFGIGEIVGHVYSSYQWNAVAGEYTPFTATLTVTDNGGLSDDDDCIVNVSIAGDANYDGTVNVLDASMTGLRWGKTCADCPGVCWGAEVMADKADLNNDRVVNVLDTSIVGLCWGNNA